VTCIIRGRLCTGTGDRYPACNPCFKAAARGAARFFLRWEARRNPMLYDETVQRARLKTLVNRYEKIIKRRLRRRSRPA